LARLTKVFVDNDEELRHNGGMMARAAVLSMLFLAPIFGQAPAFEVADVRPYKREAGVPGIQGIIAANGVLRNFSQVYGQRMQLGDAVFAANGTVTLRCVTLRELMTQAYTEILRPSYLTGGPAWLETDNFEVIAKAPPGNPVDTERLMLQRLLAERFHLVVRREQRPMPVFALVAGKKELKLPAPSGTSDADCKAKFAAEDGRTHVTCVNMTMGGLADRLPRLEPFDVDQPAVDLTNIVGPRDFAFEWTPHKQDSGPVGLTIFDALEKLGLKLEARKEPMTVIAIDHVEKPDAN
jgi:uncharacterized protein (TIGR03435 family)